MRSGYDPLMNDHRDGWEIKVSLQLWHIWVAQSNGPYLLSHARGSRCSDISMIMSGWSLEKGRREFSRRLRLVDVLCSSTLTQST